MRSFIIIILFESHGSFLSLPLGGPFIGYFKCYVVQFILKYIVILFTIHLSVYGSVVVRYTLQ